MRGRILAEFSLRQGPVGRVDLTSRGWSSTGEAGAPYLPLRDALTDGPASLALSPNVALCPYELCPEMERILLRGKRLLTWCPPPCSWQLFLLPIRGRNMEPGDGPVCPPRNTNNAVFPSGLETFGWSMSPEVDYAFRRGPPGFFPDVLAFRTHNRRHLRLDQWFSNSMDQCCAENTDFPVFVL